MIASELAEHIAHYPRLRLCQRLDGQNDHGDYLLTEHDRVLIVKALRAFSGALPLHDGAPKEPAPSPTDLLAAAREAFLDLRADAQRWDEDVDGDMDNNGRAVMYVNYHATFGHAQLEALCEALGIRVPFGETAGAAIDRMIADSVHVAEKREGE